MLGYQAGDRGKTTHWLKVVLLCPAVLADPVADLVGTWSETGVEVRDAAKDQGEVTGYFPLPTACEGKLDECWVTTLRGEIEARLTVFFARTCYALIAPTWTVIAAEDWSSNWKRFFKPLEIIPGLVISPSWETYQPAAGVKVLELDPGLAFGTGHHHSTRLALTLVQQVIARRVNEGCGEDYQVLDVGTGTGILGMGIARLTPCQVLGLDNDPEAVRVAHENVAINDLATMMRVSEQPLAEVEGSFQLICANILHPILMAMGEDFIRLLTKEGSLVVAGVLAGEQADDIIRYYQQLGLSHQVTEQDDEWAGLLFQR